ncbi:MAG: DUF1992 domain-containing protein [Pseudomonadota bacterium]|jgi:Domain of unknown function (DUF1992).
MDIKPEMDPVTALAERRIREAMERGEFDNLPGAGQPLDLDDDSHVPEELRAAYRLLKNAGMVPPELELRRELANAEQLLALASTPEERSVAYRRWRVLEARLALTAGHRRSMQLEQQYFSRVLEKLSGAREDER